LNELLHLAFEGLFSALLAVSGFFLKSLWNEIRELREEKDSELKDLWNRLDKIKDTAAALELRMEREFVKHSDLHWIKEKLEKFEDILDRIQLSMARHRKEDEQ